MWLLRYFVSNLGENEQLDMDVDSIKRHLCIGEGGVLDMPG